MKRIALLCTALIGGQASGQSIMVPYNDSLQSGWQNWSWATTNLGATSPVHSGTKSISVNAGAFQALFLAGVRIDSTIYSRLKFWVHGGASGGQRFRVNAQVNGVDQSGFFDFGPLAANTWTQIDIPLSTLGAANKVNLTGLIFKNNTNATAPVCYFDDFELTPIAVPALATLTANATSTLQPVDDRMFGVNAAVWDGQLNTTATHNLLKGMGNRVLRFPGGSLSDEYHWQTNTTEGQTFQWATSFDAFTNVLNQTGARATITVNYGTGTPAEAAGWVTNANILKGLGIKYWDVGNECYGTWETDKQSRKWDPVVYANRFVQYWNAMKAVDPTIKIGVPVVAGEDDYATYTDQPTVNPRTGISRNGWTPVLLAKLKANGITPDYVIYHRYEFYVTDDHDDTLLQRAKGWAADMASIRQQLTDYLGANGAGVEIQVNENNCDAGNQGRMSTSVVNGMFYLDSLANLLKTETRLFCWWDWRNGADTAGNFASHLYGWRTYGDLGMGLDATTQYPVYYSAKMMQYFARGGDSTVTATSDSPFLSGYGTRGKDGSMRVLMISKHPSATQNFSVQLANYDPATSYKRYRYGREQDENARLGSGTQDVIMENLTGATPTLTGTAQPYTGYVYVFTTKKKVLGTLDLQGWTAPLPTEATFEFRQPGTTNVVWTVTAPVSVSGSFTLNSPAVGGTYDLAVKYGHWLRKVISVNTTSGSVTGANLSLLNGDIDFDNVVSILDYSILSDFFDKSDADSDWNTVAGNGYSPAQADLDGDGTVSILDYSQLSDNFDKSGAD